jgi:hypothetical protein
MARQVAIRCIMKCLGDADNDDNYDICVVHDDIWGIFWTFFMLTEALVMSSVT